jgi:hypothetical protein
MAILPIAIRVSALRFVSFPSPSIHDEFSYLLAADTFASGRLTNPPHPMWVHFETLHEIFQPTYASEYPPGQSLFTAFGQRFLGHPWFGVCISFRLMCGCLCWMLQGFLPPVYALLGALVAMGEFNLFGYWMDSYWGGAVGTMSGSLVLGAVPQLAQSTSASTSWLASLGLMILALSRPFEGLVVTFAAVAGLLWWRHRLGRRLLDLFAAQVLGPCVLICVAGVRWLLYYNYRVTGNALLMPHTVHERTYVASPTSYLLPTPPEPIYSHETMRKNWTGWEKLYYLGARHNPLRIVLGFLGYGSVSCIDTNLSSSGSGTPCVPEESENAGDNRGIGDTMGGDVAHEILASPRLRAGGWIVADPHNVQPPLAACQGRIRGRGCHSLVWALLFFFRIAQRLHT